MKLTIITPTYNRGSTLKRCYLSLKKQNNYNFQWLIIDDGSNDQTKLLVERFKHETKKFEIDYYYKNNGGKHTALNFSHSFIKGEIVLILDSDDYLVGEAVQIILNSWEKYFYNDQICCLSFSKGWDDKQALVDIKKSEIVSNHIDFRINNGLFGDCAETIRTSNFLKFKFPTFDGEKFMTEGVMWMTLGMKYETCYINEIIYIVPRYREDGLTQAGTKMRLKNIKGMLVYCELMLNVRVSLRIRIKYALLKNCYYYFLGLKLKKSLLMTKYKKLIFLGRGGGYILYRYWKRKYGEQK